METKRVSVWPVWVEGATPFAPSEEEGEGEERGFQKNSAPSGPRGQPMPIQRRRRRDQTMVKAIV